MRLLDKPAQKLLADRNALARLDIFDTRELRRRQCRQRELRAPGANMQLLTAHAHSDLRSLRQSAADIEQLPPRYGDLAACLNIDARLCDQFDFEVRRRY